MKTKSFRVLLALALVTPFNMNAQTTDYDTGKAIGIMTNELSNSFKEIKAAILKNQQFAISNIKSALIDLENNRLDEAYGKAQMAMVAYPKYSLSYLVMAYTALEKKDFLNSHRMMVLYSKFSAKHFNKELNSDVPEEFVALVNEKSTQGFKSLSSSALSRQYQSEPWLSNALELQFLPSALVFFDQEATTTDSIAEEFPDFASDNNLALVYKKYFWFNRKGSLPFTNNNYGLCLSTGLDLQAIFPGTYFPFNYKLFIQPGIFIKKFYVSPGQVRFFKISKYPDAYTGYDDAYPSLGFLFTPEIRWYPGMLNAYATDMRKVSNDIKTHGIFRGYFFGKIQIEQLSGSQPEGESYTRLRETILFGFSIYTGKKRTTEFGCYFGPGFLPNLTIENDSTFTNVKGNFAKVGFTLTKRIL